ncbi:DUF2946 family protein [Luteimonas sp. MC1825]|uniref:DUF2946 family protein n=1 Tax=Luteimonas sp. MC1825 TaxID=2761107 RepID=UPI001610537E|nr:DUF2946 family protein [Luteimonas sp. MC1825]MBB6598816.1 DUF2946 family protein [Luteimonas sp. MC1825]QOC88972.1 DUF2946 family protein [Luteimonas sp. MC1825]
MATIMKRRAVQRWMARFGLAAMLLLLLVPTAGRLLQVALPDDSAHAAHHAAHDAHHRAAGARHHDRDASDLPVVAGQDCHYCALLASAAAIAGPGLSPVANAAPASFQGRTGFRLPWLHPNGLGSRGPPLHG